MIVPAVETREIETFLVLAEELHFGRTADRLGVSPSRVSQTLRSLEHRLGAKLVERTSRRVALTPLGNQLARTAGPAYDQLRHALAEVRASAPGTTGTLRLGMYSPINGGPHLVSIIKAFEAANPVWVVHAIDTGLTTSQLKWLRNDDVDMIATRLPLISPDTTIGPILSREQRIVAVAKDHPLARREYVEVDDLGDYAISDVVSIQRELADALAPPVTPAGRRLARTTVSNFAELTVLIALGEVVHPTVHAFLDYYAHPGITAVPLRGLPDSETALVWLTAARAPIIDAFVAAANSVLRTASATIERESTHADPSGEKVVPSARHH